MDASITEIFSAGRVGGKAHHLAWLSFNGYRVPEWIVLSYAELNKIYGSSPPEGTRLLGERIQPCLPWLQQGVAVRSSALTEDSTSSSCAGQFHTVLSVQSEEDLIKAIKRVYANEGASPAPPSSTAISVVIQKMVAAEKAGVAFTVDIAKESRKRLVVSAGRGLGDGVVSGSGDTDEYVFDRTNGQWSEENHSGEPILTPREREILLKAMESIHQDFSRDFGLPADIEWCFCNQELFILQVRPVVRFIDGETTVLDCSNIQESYSGVVAPLTASLAFRAYHLVYRQLMKVMGFSIDQIESQDERHQKMLSYHQGRIYYNINSWYIGLLMLPSFGRNKSDMETMMGLSESVELVQDQVLSISEKLKRVPLMTKTLIKLMWKFVFLQKHVQRFETEFHRFLGEFKREELPILSLGELLQKIRLVESRCLSEWGVPIINDFYVMMMQGKVKRQLAKYGLEEEIQHLLYQKNLPSLEPQFELEKLVQVFAKDPAKRIWLINKRYLNEPWKVWPEVQVWIEKYGDRCLGELKLESSSYREKPAALYDLILAHLSRSSDGISETLSQTSLQSYDRVNGKMGLIKQKAFWRSVEKLKKGIFWREQMRLERTRVFGMMRSLYRQVGQRLYSIGVIKNPDDVFYLTIPEVFDFYEGRTIHQTYEALVNERKNILAKYKNAKPDQQVHIRGPLAMGRVVLRPKTNYSSDTKVLKGLGCAPGFFRGRVQLVESLDDVNHLEGRILLAQRTDPGWTPLFQLAKALLIERGSSLSHSVVMAREMGLPVVIGIPNITELLSTGDEVEIDGTEGIVRIISQVKGGQSEAFDRNVTAAPDFPR